MKRTVAFITILALVGLLIGGCASPEQRAQKLFDTGKYEDILKKYPELPIAKQAKDKIAEKLVSEGKYEEVLANYSDTPSVTEATNKIAEKMVNDKRYDEVLAKYPNTPAANVARNALAQQMYDAKKFDELIAKYPNTPAGLTARNEMAKAEYDKVAKIKPKAKKIKALEEFVKNPKFAGTQSFADAQNALNDLTKKPEPKAKGAKAAKGGAPKAAKKPAAKK